MQYSDLHIHSNYSDGNYSPEEIIKLAKQKELKYISITDHDTVDSQINIECSEEDFYVIPGVEISTEYKGREVHILGYFIDPNNEELNKQLKSVKEDRLSRVYEILDRLKKCNINISIDELNVDKVVSIGRAHIAKLMVAKGYVSNFKSAFQNYLAKGKPGYVERSKMPFKDALSLINTVGGFASLAHPGETYKGIFMDEMVKEFKVYGLKGIEVFHPAHNLSQTNNFYNMAKKYKLLITGGSDCHGSIINGDLLMGTYGLDENLTNKILKYKHINKLGEIK